MTDRTNAREALPRPRLGVAAWHPDPTGRHEKRWWDGVEWLGGTGWTSSVCDDGVVTSDPL